MGVNLDDLRQRALRTFGEAPVEATVKRVRAIVGPVSFAQAGMGESDLVQLADAGLAALRNGQPPNAPQYAALQIMIRLARPSILSRGGRLDAYPTVPQDAGPQDPDPPGAAGGAGVGVEPAADPGELRRQAWTAFATQAEPLLPSIGRIDVDRKPQGTGFVVAPGVLLTNRHVLELISFGTLMLTEGQAQVRFDQEADTPGGRPVQIRGVVAVHPSLDLALLELAAPDPSTPGPGVPLPAPLAFDATTPQVGEGVVAIGYPVRDDRNSPTMMDRIFEGRYEVKRAAPGEVTDLGTDAVYHDCSTLGGNSGSPLCSLTTAKVVGVHSSGFFTWRNEGIAGPSAASFVAAHSP